MAVVVVVVVEQQQQSKQERHFVTFELPTKEQLFTIGFL
jgi:hypothetical protein